MTNTSIAIGDRVKVLNANGGHFTHDVAGRPVETEFTVHDVSPVLGVQVSEYRCGRWQEVWHSRSAVELVPAPPTAPPDIRADEVRVERAIATCDTFVSVAKAWSGQEYRPALPHEAECASCTETLTLFPEPKGRTRGNSDCVIDDRDLVELFRGLPNGRWRAAVIRSASVLRGIDGEGTPNDPQGNPSFRPWAGRSLGVGARKTLSAPLPPWRAT